MGARSGYFAGNGEADSAARADNEGRLIGKLLHIQLLCHGQRKGLSLGRSRFRLRFSDFHRH